MNRKGKYKLYNISIRIWAIPLYTKICWTACLGVFPDAWILS